MSSDAAYLTRHKIVALSAEPKPLAWETDAFFGKPPSVLHVGDCVDASFYEVSPDALFRAAKVVAVQQNSATLEFLHKPGVHYVTPLSHLRVGIDRKNLLDARTERGGIHEMMANEKLNVLGAQDAGSAVDPVQDLFEEPKKVKARLKQNLDFDNPQKYNQLQKNNDTNTQSYAQTLAAHLKAGGFNAMRDYNVLEELEKHDTAKRCVRRSLHEENSEYKTTYDLSVENKNLGKKVNILQPVKNGGRWVWQQACGEIIGYNAKDKQYLVLNERPDYDSDLTEVAIDWWQIPRGERDYQRDWRAEASRGGPDSALTLKMYEEKKLHESFEQAKAQEEAAAANREAKKAQEEAAAAKRDAKKAQKEAATKKKKAKSPPPSPPPQKKVKKEKKEKKRRMSDAFYNDNSDEEAEVRQEPPPPPPPPIFRRNAKCGGCSMRMNWTQEHENPIHMECPNCGHIGLYGKKKLLLK